MSDAAAAGADPDTDQPADLPEWLSLDADETVEWVGSPAYESMLAGIAVGLLFVPVFGFGLLVIAGVVLSVRNTDYVVTDKSLYVKTGVLSTNIESTDLDRIQNTEYSQSFVGAQLGYGTIEISTAGSGGSDLSFRNVADARAVRDRVNELSSAAAGRRGGRGQGAEGGDAAGEASVEDLRDELRATRESLERIERLLAEGAATGAGASGGDSGSEGQSGEDDRAASGDVENGEEDAER